MASDHRDAPAALLANQRLAEAFFALTSSERVVDERDVQERLIPHARRWGIQGPVSKQALLCLLQSYPECFTEQARQLLRDEIVTANRRDQLAAGFSCLGWRTSVAPRPRRPLPSGAECVVNDASGMSPTLVRAVVAIDSVERVQAAIARARELGVPISIAGRRHSEGGQSSAAGSLNLDMLGLNGVEVLDGGRVRVEGGATWEDVQAALAPAGRAVKVMQTSNIFSVGGSLSVNCHGRTPGMPPIIATVRSLSLVGADGEIRVCSRDQNPELFRHAIGGYGVFGVIVAAELETVEDSLCLLDAEVIDARDYPSAFADALADPAVELMHGRLAPTFSGEALIHRVRRVDGAPAQKTAGPVRPGLFGRAVFEASKHAPRLLAARWALEKRMRGRSEIGRRNEFMAPSVAPLRQYRLNEGRAVDLLHEYYVPRPAYGNFFEGLRAIQTRIGVSAVNITVRDVGREEESALPYAREDSFAFVLYYRQRLSHAEIDRHARLQRALIDLAVSCGGTFYLPYQLHYTGEQLRAAYPGIDAFWEAKRRLDPEGRFSNAFSERYGAAR